jgi:hypothetical protein
LCKRLNVNSSTDTLLRLFKVRLWTLIYIVKFRADFLL